MKEYLKILCTTDKEDTRLYRNTPWYKGGYSYSTNGFCLIRVKGEYGVEDTGQFPDAEGSFDFDKIIDSKPALFDLDKALENPKKCEDCNPSTEEVMPKVCKICGGVGEYKCHCCGEDRFCPKCHGVGEVFERVPTKECLVCFGTGIKPVSCNIDGDNYNLAMLSKLKTELPGLTLKQTSERRYIGFTFNGGSGALMSLGR